MAQSKDSINLKKAASILKLSCLLSTKLTLNQCEPFYNMKKMIEAEFMKTIHDKLYEQMKVKTSPTYTVESPLKSQLSSKISQKKDKNELDIKSEEITETKEKMGKILDKIQKKCLNVEKIGESAFSKWRNLCINKEKGAIIINSFLRNILHQRERVFIDKIKSGIPNLFDNKSKKFLSIIQILQKKTFILSWKAFNKIKVQRSHFNYIKEIHRFVSVFEKIRHRNKINAIHSMKVQSQIINFKNTEILKRFIYICEHFKKNRIITAFLNIKSETEAQQNEKINLTNRIKGRILIACYKQAPVFSLKNAFMRFRVRSDQKLVKKAIDRFKIFI